jgi:acyl-CoA thioester hydrolase
LDEFTVDIVLAGATSDVRRMAVRNRFHTRDGRLCAEVDSIILWFDLAQRRPAAPPPPLRDLWLALERSEDFRTFDAP